MNGATRMECEYQYDSSCTMIAKIVISYVDPHNNERKKLYVCRQCLIYTQESFKYFGIDYSIIDIIQREKVIFN